jgi:hypothetical protein
MGSEVTSAVQIRIIYNLPGYDALFLRVGSNFSEKNLLLPLFTLKMEATGPFETSATIYI